VTNDPGKLRTISLRDRRSRRQSTGIDLAGDGQTEPEVITDQLLWRMALSSRLVRLLPCFSAVRELQRKVQAIQHPCCGQKAPQIDLSPLDIARRALASCSGDLLSDVKIATGIPSYKVTYRGLDGKSYTAIK
jgi:hypothetical protein